MKTLLRTVQRKQQTAAERKAANSKAEQDADLAFLAREKKRKPVHGTAWAKVKKDIGL